MDENSIIAELFGLIQGYSAHYTSLSDAVKMIARDLRLNGHTVSTPGNGHIDVDNEHFVIKKHKGWTRYEVRSLD